MRVPLVALLACAPAGCGSAPDDFAVLAEPARYDPDAMAGAASLLSRLRQHVDSYEYDEANVIAARLLEQIERQAG